METEQDLNEEQLEELFKRTSAFTVKTANLETDMEYDELDMFNMEMNDQLWDEEEEYLILSYLKRLYSL